MLKATHGMLQSALLFHQQFGEDLENKSCEFDPCDPRVASKTVAGKQHTITFHVDDLKCSNAVSGVNNTFVKWLDANHGEDEIRRVKAVS